MNRDFRIRLRKLTSSEHLTLVGLARLMERHDAAEAHKVVIEVKELTMQLGLTHETGRRCVVSLVGSGNIETAVPEDHGFAPNPPPFVGVRLSRPAQG